MDKDKRWYRPCLREVRSSEAGHRFAFAQRYLKEQVEVHASLSTQRDYRSMLENIVVPKLGSMRLEDVTRADIERLHGSLKHKPARANRMLSVVKAMYNKAGDWGVLSYSENPAMRLKPHKEAPRQRYFNENEQHRIASAIRQLRQEHPLKAWADLTDDQKDKKSRRAKHMINTSAVGNMSAQRLGVADPAGEILGWLQDVADMMSAVD